jgi:hypothetical protein
MWMMALVGASLVLAVAPSTYGQRRRGGGGGGRAAAPSPQAQALMADRKEISTIEGELATINTKVAEVTRKAMDEAGKTDEFQAAQKAIDDANTDVKRARDNAMTKLNANAEYKEARAKELAAQAKMAQLKTEGATAAEREAQSKLVLDLGGVTSKMERDALASDTDYAAAQKKLSDSIAAMKVLHDKVTESLKSNEEYKGLAQQQEDTKQKLADAKKKLSTDQASNAH